MAKTKDQKKKIIERLSDAFKTAKSSVFVRFINLAVSDEVKMRKDLREKGIKYFVAKKSLIKKACTSAGLPDFPKLEGEVAVVYGGSDSTEAGRETYSFVKKFKEKLAIVGGFFEGVLKGETEMNEIATIPSAQVLRGMFVNVVNSPIQGFVSVLSKIAEKKQG